MKKTKLFAAMSSLAAIFAVSCVKETPNGVEENPVEPGFKTVTLTAGVQTKMNSADDVLRWNTGKEQLAVFGQVGDNMVKYLFTKQGSATTPTSASFTGTVSENAVLKYAAYPYVEDDEKCNCTSDGVFTFKLDPGQIFNAANSVSAYPPLYSIVEGESITMKSACAYLRIMLPYDNSQTSLPIFKSVEIKSQGISGTFTLDCTGDTPIVSAGNGTKITCTPKNSKSGALYVPVIPGTYDDITITVNYTDDCGYPAFVKQSRQTQTFEMGKFYDCKEVSGAYIESVTTGAATVEGTTLTMNASAVIWKYSGITNSNYTAKFFYSEEGADDWNEVEAEISGETNEVTLSASATVDASKTYQYYAQVYDGTKIIDGEIISAISHETIDVEFILNGNHSSITEFNYLTPKEGYRKVVDQDGNDVFPTFGVGKSGATYYYKVYENGKYGDIITATKLPVSTSDGGNFKMIGCTLTRKIDDINYSILLNSTIKYYSYTSNMLCCDSGYNIKMLCPTGYKIKKVTLKIADNNKKCVWGLHTSSYKQDNEDSLLVPSVEYTNADGPVNAEIAIPNATVDTPYYLISGAANNRLGWIVITYEK